LGIEPGGVGIERGGKGFGDAAGRGVDHADGVEIRLGHEQASVGREEHLVGMLTDRPASEVGASRGIEHEHGGFGPEAHVDAAAFLIGHAGVGERRIRI
jgi:hypothetical protein